VHQVAEYDRERGISYWTKNYRTGIERSDEDALDRRYTYYDPIATLPDSGQAWWRGRGVDPVAADVAAAASRSASLTG
jgi:lysine 2,3-aminomutase